MDALKKAELAKRKAEADNASVVVSASTEAPSPATGKAAPEPITLTPQALDDGFSDASVSSTGHPADTASPVAAVPEDDTLSLQEIGIAHERRRHKRQFVRPPAETVQAATTTDGSAERAAIRNLFETKQSPNSRKTFAIIAGTITTLAVAVIGGYFWYELQPKSGLQAGVNLNNKRPPPVPDIPIVAPSVPAPSEPVIAGLTTPSETPHTEPSDKGETRPLREIVKTRPATIPEKKLFQLSKAAEPRTDPALERGYNALNHGDTATAKTAYEQALGNDPRNIDALSGLAVLAQRAGNQEQAADYYRRILEADPHHAFALAGFIGQRTQMNPAEAETQLRQALSTQPDSAPLNFSLGNLYASAKRWTEAQQVYFKAMTADPGNPDYLFNLAVSLDQLHQSRLAASYYAQAIAAAGSRPASFDPAKASERLRQLQQ